MASRIVPLLNRIVIQKLEAPLKSAGGIILRENKDKDAQLGKVVKVGPGAIFENGRTRENLLKPGQNVLLPSYSGQEIEIDKEKLYIYKDTEILGVLD
jgi:chaperonin GroES